MRRAVFLDRDGVINPLVYLKEIGIIDSPFKVSQIRLLPRAAAAIKGLKKMGFVVVVVSNQPGIAKNKFTETALVSMTKKLVKLLRQKGALLDQIYYCLHHPESVQKKYRKICGCRKPLPGLLKQAMKDFNIDARKSYLIGDNLSDIKAGKAVGAATLLVGSEKCDHCKLMQKNRVVPDHIINDLYDGYMLIKEKEGK